MPISRAVRSVALGALFLIAFTARLHAEPVIIAWDANAEPDLAGYIVSYGVEPGVYPLTVDVGNRVSWSFELTDGQYYFVVQPYTTAGLFGPLSFELFVSVGVGSGNAPVLTSPSDQTHPEGATVSLQLLATDQNGDTLTYAANGLPPGLTLDHHSGAIAGILPYGSAGSYAVSVSVSDAEFSTQRSFTWFVVAENRPPAIAAPGAQTSAEGQPVSLTLAATDPDGDALTFSATGLPTALSVDPSTGLISGMVSYTAAANSPYAVTVTVSDGTLSDSTSFSWSVGPSLPSNQPPTAVVGAAPTSGPAPLTVAFTGSGSTDFDGSIVSFAWEFGDGQTATVADSTHTYLAGGTFTATLTVTDDGGLSDSGSVEIGVGQVSVYRINAGGNSYTDSLGQLWEADLGFNTGETFATTVGIAGTADPVLSQTQRRDPAGHLEYSLPVANGVHRVNLYFADISVGTHSVGARVFDVVIEGTVVFDNLDIFVEVGGFTALVKSVEVEVTDGVLDIQLFHEVENPAINAIEVMSLERAPTAILDATPTNGTGPLTVVFTGSSSTDSDGSIVSFAWEFGDGQISAEADPSHTYLTAGTFTARLTVTDDQGLSDSGSVGISVGNTNQAPALGDPGAQSSAEGQPVSLTLSATDPDGDRVTYGATVLPAGLSLDASTGAITGTVDYTASAGSPYTVTVTASDGTLSDSTSFTWTVTNTNRAPALGDPGAQASADGETVALTLVASDPDGDVLSYSVSGVSSSSQSTPPALAPPVGTVVTVNSETELQDAVNSLTSNTTIMIAAGTYTLTSTLWINGLTDVALRGATGNREDVVLVGPGMANPNYGGVPHGVWIGDVQGITVADLTIRDVYFHPIILNAGTESPHLYNVRLLDAGEQFLKSNPDGGGGGVDNGIVEYSTFEYTTTSRSDYTNAIDVHTGDNWIIRHNAFTNIRAPEGQLAGPAILMWNGSTDTVVEGNAFINCQREIAFGLVQRSPNDHTGGIIRNNFIYREPGQSGDAAIGVWDSPTTEVLHNTILLSGSWGTPIEYRFADTTGVVIKNNLLDGNIVSRDGASGLVGTNVTSATAAMFVDAASGDLHLTASATAAIDQAESGTGVSNDWDGDSRPQGAASDIGADEFTVPVGAAPGLPPGLSLDATTGLISGMLEEGAAAGSPYTVTASVSDGLSSVSATFTWTVVDGSGAPSLSDPGSQTSAEGEMIALTLVAADPDGDAVTYGATGLPAGLSLDGATGAITGTVAYTAAAASPYTVLVTATDGGLSDTVTFTWTVTNTNRVPALTDPGAQASVEGEIVALALVASDPDGDAVSYQATGLPAGLSLNSSTGAVSGALGYTVSVGSPYSVTVTVDDGQGGTDTASFTWTVADRNGVPVLTTPAAQSDAEGETVTLTLGATDPDGDTLTYGATGLPTGLSLDGPTGAITGTLDYAASADSPHTVTVTVSDGDLSDAVTLTWTVTNTNRAPALTDPGVQAGAEGQTVALTLAATDPDGDALTYGATGLPAGLALDPSTWAITGTVDYAASAASPYTVTVTATDGDLSDSATFAWTVTNTNRAPALTDPGSQVSAEGETVALTLAATDPDSDVVTYGATGLPVGLSLDGSTGAITGTLGYAASLESPYTVTVTTTDGDLSDSVSVTWTVSDTNRGPSLVVPGDQQSTEDETVALTVTATDPDGDTLTYTATGLPTGLALDSSTGVFTGTVDYTASAGSPYTVTVTVTDGDLTDSATLTWTVANTNRAPALSDPGPQASAEGEIVALTLAASDPDGDAVTYGATGLPTGLVLDPTTGAITGVLDYTASAGSPDAVTVTATDGDLTDSVSVTWTVANSNRAPVLSDPGAQTSAEGATVTLTLAATDPDGDGLGYAASNLPFGLSLDPATGEITGTIDYTAATGSPYQVVATVSDGELSDSATFMWTVANTNRAPALTDPGAQASAEGETVALTLAASDPDDDTVSYQATGLPAGLSLDSSTGEVGGALSYTVSVGSPYSVTVTADDGQGGTDTVSFTWTVAARNGAPTLVAPEAQASAEGETVTLTLGATDPDGDVVTYGAMGLPAGLSLDSTTGEIAGTINYEASVTSPYTVTVTVTDGDLTDSATLTWTVANTNRAPALSDPGPQASAEGEIVALTLAASDPDGDAVTYGATGLPTGLVLDPTTGAITGVLDYTASAGSPDAVTVTATDGDLTDSVSVTWTVANSNRAPVLSDPGAQTSAEGATVALTLAATDPDGDTVRYGATGLPAGLSLDGAMGAITGTLGYTVSVGSPYSVTVTVDDGDGGTDTATFTWTVADRNGRPTLAVPEGQSDAEEATVTLTLAATDPDGDGLGYAASNLPFGLSLDPATGEITGTIDYTAATGSPYQVVATVSDGELSDSATFMWTVANTNRAPALTDPGAQASAEGETVALTLAASDPDDDTVSYQATGLPAGLSLDSSTGEVGGALSYTVSVGSPYSVTVTADDGQGGTDTVSFTWTVAARNGAPTLVAPEAQASAEGETVTLTLGATDPDGDVVTYGAMGLPAGLSLDSTTGEIAGTINYEASVTSPYTVTVTVTDGDLTDSATLTWTVANTNRAPALSDPGPQASAEGEIVALTLAASDPDGDAVTYGATGLPTGLSLNPSSGEIAGTLDFTAAAGSPYTAWVTASDRDLTHTVSFTWTVENVNRPPVIAGVEAQDHAEGDMVSLQLAATDPDAEPLEFGATGLPTGLSLDSATGQLGGILAYSASQSSPYAVTVTVSDGALADTTSFTWSVADRNGSPELMTMPDQISVEGADVSEQLQASDPDGDPISYGATGLPPGLNLNPTTGSISGVLDADTAVGSPYSVNWAASDGDLTVTSQFSWTVASPVAAVTTTEAPSTVTATSPQRGSSLSATVSDADSSQSTGSFASTDAASIGSSGGSGSGEQSNLDQVAPPDATPVEPPEALPSMPPDDPASDRAEAPPSGVSDDAADTVSGTASGGVLNVPIVIFRAPAPDESESAPDARAFGATPNRSALPPPGSPAAAVSLATIARPDDREDAEGDTVSIEFQRAGAASTLFTFSVDGLPLDLTIDSVTGLISGTIDAGAAEASPYETTVWVTDGTLTIRRDFTWTVNVASVQGDEQSEDER